MPSVADRLSGAFPLQALQPFDGYGFTDLVAPRRSPAARLASRHRVNNPVTQVL